MRGKRPLARGSAAALLAGLLMVSLAPLSHAQPGPIVFTPTRGPVGASVTITGSGLSTVTSVLFGTSPASFTVDSDEQLTATVPPGADTAIVEVDAPDGTSVSAEPFVVQPNILVILTDDQRWDTLGYMPTVESQLAGKGITFSNAFVENALCCPSRASFLTGQDSHTTGVYSNDAPNGGFSAFDDHATLATWLNDAGYNTFMTGKYLNHYWDTNGLYEPPGWDRWRAFASASPYFNYDISLDGLGVQSYGSKPQDYSTDVIAWLGDDLIRQASAQDPLFLWVAPLAPHEPFTPAPRDVGTFSGIAPWRPPSYDEADMRDKPAYMQALPRLSTDERARIDGVRQRQIETLGAVDDTVGTLLQALADTGRLGDTIVVFTSDNGFLWGEHRRFGKVVPYEESIRVPLVIRWDRMIGSARSDTHLVQNVDLAPTLVQAGAATASGFDGRSLLPLLAGGSVAWRSHLLIEHHSPGAPTYCADRTPKDIFVRYETGEEEYYRLGPLADVYERTNRITDPRFQTRIAALRNKTRTMCSPLPPGMPPF